MERKLAKIENQEVASLGKRRKEMGRSGEKETPRRVREKSESESAVNTKRGGSSSRDKSDDYRDVKSVLGGAVIRMKQMKI